MQVALDPTAVELQAELWVTQTPGKMPDITNLSLTKGIGTCSQGTKILRQNRS